MSMNEGSGVIVFWILVPVFVAIGLYLVWYMNRRKKMLDAFAKTHRFQIRPESKNELQKILDSCYSPDNEGVVRMFRSAIELGRWGINLDFSSS